MDTKSTYVPKMHLHLRKGALHKALGLKANAPISAGRLDKALKSKDAHMRKMAKFAKNAKSWKH